MQNNGRAAHTGDATQPVGGKRQDMANGPGKVPGPHPSGIVTGNGPPTSGRQSAPMSVSHALHIAPLPMQSSSNETSQNHTIEPPAVRRPQPGRYPVAADLHQRASTLVSGNDFVPTKSPPHANVISRQVGDTSSLVDGRAVYGQTGRAGDTLHGIPPMNQLRTGQGRSMGNLGLGHTHQMGYTF